VWSGQLSLLPSAEWEMSSGLRTTGWRPSWLIGAVVCLLAAPRVHVFIGNGNGWPHDARLSFAVTSACRADVVRIVHLSVLSVFFVCIAHVLKVSFSFQFFFCSSFLIFLFLVISDLTLRSLDCFLLCFRFSTSHTGSTFLSFQVRWK